MAASLVLLAACGTTPKPGPGTRAADEEACSASVPDAVDKRNAKTMLSWVAGPVRRWGQIDSATTACMAERGRGTTRACTEAELRSAPDALGPVVRTVTANGIRCTDPDRR